MADHAGDRLISLRHPDLRRYLAARFLVLLAVQVQTVAVGWQVFSVSGDPLDLGLVGLSQFVPFVLLVLPAGHAADRYDRRRLMAVTYLLLALCSALLLLLSLVGVTSNAPILAVMVLFGAARAINMPTGQALLPNLAPPGAFANAVALNSSLLQIGTVLGPAIGGIVVLAGTEAAYGLALGLLVAGVVLVAGLRGGARLPQTREPISLGSLLSGVAFVRSRRPVLGSISLDLFAVLFGGATALLPIYAGEILDVGPAGLGLMRAAPAVGAALCAASVAIRPIRRHVGRWMFGGVAAYGAATIVFGLSRDLGLTLAALLVMGAGDQVSVYIRHLLVQLETPDEIRGRVSAVNAVFIGASNELGDFESGLTASWWGVTTAVVVGGGATLAVTVTWSRLFDGLWRLDRFPAPADRDAAPVESGA